MRVLFWVQQLLGSGHLKRAATLARAMADEGLEVILASGGMPMPSLLPDGVEVIQLPAIRTSDPSFAQLVDAAGRPVGDAMWQERQATPAAPARPAPAAGVDHGNVPVRPARLPARAAAAARGGRGDASKALAAVLGPRHPGAKAFAGELRLDARSSARSLRPHPRAHRSAADPVRADLSLRHSAEGPPDRYRLCGRCRRGPAGARPASPKCWCRPAAGGSARRSWRRRSRRAPRPAWRRRRGDWSPAAISPPTASQRSTRDCPKGSALDRHRTDFDALLANSLLSVSQAGYNTVVEGLRLGKPMVLVPFETAIRDRATDPGRTAGEPGARRGRLGE